MWLGNHKQMYLAYFLKKKNRNHRFGNTGEDLLTDLIKWNDSIAFHQYYIVPSYLQQLLKSIIQIIHPPLRT